MLQALEGAFNSTNYKQTFIMRLEKWQVVTQDRRKIPLNEITTRIWKGKMEKYEHKKCAAANISDM